MRWILGFVVCLAAHAADVSGSWLLTGPRGNQVLELKENAGKLSGKLIGPMGTQVISDGSVEGNSFKFTVKMSMFGQERVMNYAGKIDGDRVELTMERPTGMFGPGGMPKGGGFGPTGPMIGKRATSEELAQFEASRPKPLPLPALQTLPWNGLAKTPPMGWNSWNHFRAQISDKLVREVADAMASNGMKEAGYVYLNIDDGWQGKRDANGILQPNERFPDMKALSAYVHSKGLKLGIYSSPGPRTCGGFEGSHGFEEKDAQTWADWGIDFLKYDWCSARQIYSNDQMQAVYLKMALALRKTGRPIVYSICQYGEQQVQQWAPSVGGNLWRTTFDIRASWDSMSSIGFRQAELAPFAKPGHWNDPDMLEVGNEGLNHEEQKTHFTLWAMLASPLLAGNDVRSMSPEVREILLNKEVIAINQDSLGKQATRLASANDLEVWSKPLSRGKTALAFFNRSAQPMQIKPDWATLGVKGARKLRDLWAHQDLNNNAASWKAEIPPHGVVLLRID